MKALLLTLSFVSATVAVAATKPVLADLALLKKTGIPVLLADENLSVGYAQVTDQMESALSENAHHLGRCGNYEVLNSGSLENVKKDLQALNEIKNKEMTYLALARNEMEIKENAQVTTALAELSSENIKTTVTWLSSFPTRFNRGTDANRAVQEFYEKLKTLTANAKFPVTVDLITHRNTPQKSIRVSVKGATRPDELIVLGGHLDSINGWMGTGRAPGADDNASGSADLVEALRVLLTQNQPARTVEFMWYAGEESGLLGSAEIAETYKTERKNVIAVLQLDMTMFPGDGEFKITSMTDFTTPWLRDYLKAINTTYIKAEISEDQCGYGCSDHASWNRRGFPTIFPTESKFHSSFQYIHTDKDVVSSVMSFQHSLLFAKIALVMALDLGNSTQQSSLF